MGAALASRFCILTNPGGRRSLLDGDTIFIEAWRCHEGSRALSTAQRSALSSLLFVHDPLPLCCMDQLLAGEVRPRYPLSFEAALFLPPKLQHAVQRRDGNGHLGRLPPIGPRAQRVADHALVAADIRLRGTPIVARCPRPAHAAARGNQLQVPVALRRRDLCCCAWHCVRTWRHNDRRRWMTLADLAVDIVPIVHSIAGKRRNRTRNLLKQGTDLRARHRPSCWSARRRQSVRCRHPPRYGAFSRTGAAWWRASRRATHRDRRA